MGKDWNHMLKGDTNCKGVSNTSKILEEQQLR